MSIPSSAAGRLFGSPIFFEQTDRAGVGSLPLVSLVSFFLGLTMALLTGYQLRTFGTERLVPGLVAVGFTRELGPAAHRHHARRPHRRRLYGGAWHHDRGRGSGGHRGHGHRSAPFPGLAPASWRWFC